MDNGSFVLAWEQIHNKPPTGACASTGYHWTPAAHDAAVSLSAGVTGAAPGGLS